MLLRVIYYVLAFSSKISRSASTVYTILERIDAQPPHWKVEHTVLPAERIGLRVALRQHRKPYMEDLALNVSVPGHGQYGKYLTQAMVDTYMHPQIESFKAVNEWLQDFGLPGDTIENVGNWIYFQAPVFVAEQLLNTKFRWYRNTLTKTRIIRTLEYSIPKPLLEHIDFIYPTVHFNFVRQSKSRSLSKLNAVAKDSLQALRSRAVEHQAPPLNATFCNRTITPDCLKALYNVDLTDIALKSGDNEKLAICGFDNEYAKYKDLELFEQKFAHYTVGNNFSLVTVNGGILPQDDSADSDAEANLDVQYGIAMSYPLPTIFYSIGGVGPLIPDLDQPDAAESANEPYLEFVQYMISLPDKELPHTISISYGEDEQSVPKRYADYVCFLFGVLGARGVSILAASGDSGPGNGCQTNDGRNTTRFNPIFPASCPWVTSVGGVYHVEPEIAIPSSSGGFSDYFTRPGYQDEQIGAYLKTLGQQWTGLYNSSGRGFPDIAAQSYNYSYFDKGKESRFGGTRYNPLLASAIWPCLR